MKVNIVLSLLAATASLAPQLTYAQAPKLCTAVVVPFNTTRRVGGAVVEMADRNIRGKLTERGCQMVEPKAVAAMKSMLRFPRRPQPADWVRLGKGLLADVVVAGSLSDAGAEVSVHLLTCQVSTSQTLERSATVPPAELLPTVMKLLDESLVSAAPAAQPPPASVPASLPVVVPPPAAPAPPRPVAPPEPRVAAPTPPPQPTPPAPPPVETIKRRQSTQARMLLATGFRAFGLFSPKRGGPAIDIEIGGVRENYHFGFFFRPYFGDVTGYNLGGRIEGGPHIGPIRLAFGAGMALMFMQDADNPVALYFPIQLVGAVYRWKNLFLAAEAFTLEIHLFRLPKGSSDTVDVVAGFSSAVNVGASF